MRYILLFFLALSVNAGAPFSVSDTSWPNATEPFVANTAVFGNPSAYIQRSQIMTNLTDGKAFTVSFWLKMNSGDGAHKWLWTITASANERLRMYRTAANKLDIVGKDSVNTTILQALSNGTITVANGWVHVYLTVDLANSSNRHLYLNGVEDAVTWTTYSGATDLDMSPTNPNFTIGLDPTTGLFLLPGSLAEFWFDDSYLNDPTKFALAGAPISLGASGQVPTGSAPVLYLSRNGSGNSWVVDSAGNTNTFQVISGPLGTTTPP